MPAPPRVYESVALINATLEDPQIDSIIEKIQDFIVKQGGTIRTVDKWGRKRLAYPINKKNNGFFAVFEFEAPGDAIAKLSRYYALEEQVLRHLTIQLDRNALRAKAQAAARAAEAAAAAAESEAPAAPQAARTLPAE
jgi:small subunit ribosomal protein S6